MITINLASGVTVETIDGRRHQFASSWLCVSKKLGEKEDTQIVEALASKVRALE